MEFKDNYTIEADGIHASVKILTPKEEFVPIYALTYPDIEPATKAILDAVKEKLITELDIRPDDVIDPAQITVLKKRFIVRSGELLKEEIPGIKPEKLEPLVGILVHQSLGLGIIEIMLHDSSLEEIVVNNAKEPIWVYHRSRGWLKTNITIPSETDIYNYAAMIGRRVGSQITHLSPLMDAYLPTGDRANATLFPISSKGNTLTIRKFASRPWTITDFL
ncbi:MAG: Flp pilus assembly complex ATPase component TadA [Bacteroidetes bacterium]|nr:Flp pilus assembly complex ATPase component TadA [Bacteroidota bacterium]